MRRAGRPRRLRLATKAAPRMMHVLWQALRSAARRTTAVPFSRRPRTGARRKRVWYACWAAWCWRIACRCSRSSRWRPKQPSTKRRHRRRHHHHHHRPRLQLDHQAAQETRVDVAFSSSCLPALRPARPSAFSAACAARRAQNAQGWDQRVACQLRIAGSGGWHRVRARRTPCAACRGSFAGYLAHFLRAHPEACRTP